MRIAICYYSGSGNTKLACQYLARHLDYECDLLDVTRGATNLSGYDAVGFAAWADFGGISKRVETYLAELPSQSGKPAFALATYGFMCGRTLADLAEQAAARDMTVLSGHQLRMPESYPPMRALGLPFDRRPNAKDLRRFNEFAAELNKTLAAIERGEEASTQPIRLGLLGGLRAAAPRTAAREDMGEKFVDEPLCTECGTCAKQCPYGAIKLDSKPNLDSAACFGCWRCYNACPEHAIYTKRFRGGPYYGKPSEHARKVLGG